MTKSKKSPKKSPIKSPEDSFTIMTRTVLPRDLNNYEVLYGGRLLDWIDEVTSASAKRHSNQRMVMVGIHKMDFISAVPRESLFQLEAKVVYARRTSVTTHVVGYAEHYRTSKRVKTCEGYITYVAVDKSYKPIPVPQLTLKTIDDQKHWEKAMTIRDLITRTN
ncbi:MAG: acyl-CoA thioesterase [Candidatus Ranarchaeia archaeon]|jgi:acyl-CoA hydrolase